MSRTDPFYRQDAEDCIRMMRFMSRNVMEEMKTIENCVKVYKKMYPDWETEDEKDHYFFYDVSFIDDAIKEYSYPAVICDDEGCLHIAYTWRRYRIKYVKVKV